MFIASAPGVNFTYILQAAFLLENLYAYLSACSVNVWPNFQLCLVLVKLGTVSYEIDCAKLLAITPTCFSNFRIGILFFAGGVNFMKDFFYIKFFFNYLKVCYFK